ncbi:MAG: outer membrane lipoprotein-sorting protein [Gammaproteobacteria bacterium]|nr:outer membrane lipoprotein-sorting protein [Gammaproteobacteria bacterium]MCP5201565.1 outer membrane lipoprotein-sorting protein [Gammaproteobacteria bacterium]
MNEPCLTPRPRIGRRLCAGLGAAALLLTATAHATDAAPDPGELMNRMHEALVPTTAQLTRVHVSIVPGDGSHERHDWTALVARQRFADGPHNAIALESPEDAAGSAILTAPRMQPEEGIGLWLYAPAERRARELSPLEADRHFLLTDFTYDDLALSARDFVEPALLGEEKVAGHDTWKVRVKPDKDWYYSRIVTWIDKQSLLPIKREYYDRAFRLWKVVDYKSAMIDGVPTIMDVDLHDVQSQSRSRWQVLAVSYDSGIAEQDFTPLALGELAGQPFWQSVLHEHDERVAAVAP